MQPAPIVMAENPGKKIMLHNIWSALPIGGGGHRCANILAFRYPPPHYYWRTDGFTHRVGRVLSFFSSRRNWDSPNPSPAGENSPPPFGFGGREILAGERVGKSQLRRGDIHCGTLGEKYSLAREWESPNSVEGT
jgi:hypothetical protein